MPDTCLYSENFIRYFLKERYIYIQYELYTLSEKKREERRTYFYCLWCGQRKLFYATYKIGNIAYGCYCWECWRNKVGKTKKLDIQKSMFFQKEGDEFYIYLDFSRALDSVHFSNQQKQCLKYYMENYTFEEIAEILHISIRSVRVHIDRAVEKIADFLNGLSHISHC